MRKGKTASRQSRGKKVSEKPGKEKPGKKEKPGPGKREKPGFGKKVPGLKVLVPLLSKREAEPSFVERVASKAREVILLLVIDTKAMSGEFGFATNEIAAGNALMQQVKASLGKKRKSCNDVIEWGNTTTKIEHLAQLYQVDKIYVVRQDNHFFRKLLEDMRQSLKEVEVETVRLPDWK